jgi:hypothetical protein
MDKFDFWFMIVFIGIAATLIGENVFECAQHVAQIE